MGSLMAAAILFPILTGTGLLIWNPVHKKHRERYILFATVATSLLTASCIFLSWKLGADAFTCTPIRFSQALSLTLRIDGASRIFGAMIAALWPVTAIYAFEYMEHEGSENRFFGFFTIAFGVVLGVAFAANFLTLYLFYELLTLATLPLVMHTMDHQARYAGKKYLIYSLSGAAFAFIGMVFLLNYGTSLDFTLGGVLDESLSAGNEQMLLWAFLCAFFGFGVKAAIFPFHGWLPDASVAPTPVSALLHAVAVVKSGVFAVMRLIYFGFGADFLRGTFAQDVAMAAAIVTIVYGSARALRTPHLKRRLAYSTVSNLSYILFGFTLMTPEGMAGGLTHMVYHAVIKITLFFCAGAILCKTGKEYVYDLEGFGHAMPVVFGTFTISSVALIGVPPLGGFVGKWCIASAAAATGSPLAYWGIGALILSTLLTTLYLMTVVLRGYFPVGEEYRSNLEHVTAPGAPMRGTMLLLTAAGIAAAFCSGELVHLIRQAAYGLF